MTTIETPVPLLQHQGEFDQLLDLYRQRHPRRVLEVGTYHGGTLYHWLQNAQPGAVIVSIDHHIHADNRHLYPDWTTPDVELHVISGDSTDPDTATRAARHAPYDWIFIDADHHDPSVRADWRHYSPLAAPGSVVVLHDITETSDPSIDVAPLWAELTAAHDTTEITEPGGFGIGVVLIPQAAQADINAEYERLRAAVQTADEQLRAFEENIDAIVANLRAALPQPEQPAAE
jgi:predicted O-methyltransferase YrrM